MGRPGAPAAARLVLGAAALELSCGDITREHAGAIVNAANSSLLGGGGVDGAIHRAGGPAILEECRAIRAARGPLPAGQAVITTAGALAADHVIHTVGPIWRGGDQGEPELLGRCYVECLALARERGLRSVAFPSISTGAYRYPVPLAAGVALGAIAGQLRERPGSLELVRVVLFDEPTLAIHRRALEDLEP